MATALAEPPVTRPRPTLELLEERIDQGDEARKESSRRLHLEIEVLRQRFEAYVSAQEKAPLNVENIRFPLKVMVGIVAGVLMLFGMLYSVSRDIETLNKEQRLQGIKIEELKETIIRQGAVK